MEAPGTLFVIAPETSIPPTTVRQMLNSNGMYPVATILPEDLERRLNFYQWMVEVEHVYLHNQILFSDASLFTQDGLSICATSTCGLKTTPIQPFRQNRSTDLQFMSGVAF